MIIRTKAYPRAALIGNPSDGYFGKTIAFVFKNFCAEVTLYQTPKLEILPCERDGSVFQSVNGLVRDVRLYGYYGGIRLLKAAVKRFADYCMENHIEFGNRNFTIQYQSNIPHQVGLAGSSAIITAAFRAMMAFYHVEIPLPILANLILSVEKEELGISAGLQDRVAQSYEGLIYMDFDRELMEKRQYGQYESLNADRLPPLYIAYNTQLSETSDVFHNNIRERFERREEKVVKAMKYWADLTVKAKKCLAVGTAKQQLGKLLDANFDRRSKIYKISFRNLEMVSVARSAGASAKFTGSGGAIIGTYTDENMFNRLKKKMAPLKVKVIKPKIVKRK